MLYSEIFEEKLIIGVPSGDLDHFIEILNDVPHRWFAISYECFVIIIDKPHVHDALFALSQFVSIKVV